VNITQIMIPMDLDNVLEIAINKLNENHFLDSQRGIARFFAEELLIADDGKMKMVCTDTSRERFKYIDQEGNLKLDIQARDFIKKIYPPIYQVSEKIYNAIINRCKELNYLIESGKDKETDRTSVKIKEQAANNSWTEIRFIKSNDSNLNFRKELALRLCV
ncbi:hypothetical protein EBS02_10350, partial [bacterium]|nr:hypothetical protein [bacterium]